MKTIITLASFTLLFSLGCKKDNSAASVMEVERNCTGTYLLSNGKYYGVCNYKALDNFKKGDMVRVAAHTTNDCSAEWRGLCLMYFSHEGVIYIDKISQ